MKNQKVPIKANASTKDRTGSGGQINVSAKTNTMAIIALIFTFLFPLVGLIIGVMALKQIKRTKEKGKGLAVIAILISSLWVAVVGFVVIYFGSIFFGAYVRDGIGTQQGKNSKLPASFPSSMPIYPGAIFESVKSDWQTESIRPCFNIIASTNATADEVIVFYKKQLSKNGWTVKEDDGFLRVYNTDYDGKIKLSRVTGDVNTLTINYILCKER